METDDRIVELIGDDGEVVKFEHLMTLEHGDDLFVLLTPVEPETADEEGSVLVMRIDADENGDDCYVIEEDDAVQEAVFNRFLDITDEMDAEDE
ncbi:MAG: DUF1292 domain-containing protein [Clostridia bacterium]|nr:DUF1292 domain-containing protein [Clostridia bacterium]